jgi:hypothetical protein
MSEMAIFRQLPFAASLQILAMLITITLVGSI